MNAPDFPPISDKHIHRTINKFALGKYSHCGFRPITDDSRRNPAAQRRVEVLRRMAKFAHMDGWRDGRATT